MISFKFNRAIIRDQIRQLRDDPKTRDMFAWASLSELAPQWAKKLHSIYFSKKYASFIIQFHDGWKLNTRTRLWYHGKATRSSTGTQGTW